MMPDLFTKPYPESPGYQDRDTSRDAAARVVNMREIHHQILGALVSGPMTFYEMADYLKIDSRRIQPRMSELAKNGKIIDSGERRETPYGRKGIAWRLA